MEGSTHRSSSRPRPPSRPTTPLRPSSRSSFRDSHRHGRSSSGAGSMKPAIDALEPQFAELSDSMADLEANFMHLQLMHESIARFTESFASFLYGMNMNAFCVDFPETPIPESFQRAKQAEAQADNTATSNQDQVDNDGETTFMTADTSFIENPSTVSKPTPKFSNPRASSSRGARHSTRGSIGGRYTTRGTSRGRSSGLGRATGRGTQ